LVWESDSGWSILDGGHLASGLGELETVTDQDGSAVDAQDGGMGAEDQRAPGTGKPVQVHGGAVEEVQQAVVAEGLQAQGAHDAGDALEILAGGEPCQANTHP
jgi:hypothetical protein